MNAELAWANWSFAWNFRQNTPHGWLGAGQFWPEVDDRLAQFGYDFANKRALEVGPCDGHVTVGLCKLGASVTAIDARLHNCVKVMVRCAFWGNSFEQPVVRQGRVEELIEKYDCVVHFGVLYHLEDFAAHLRLLRDIAPIVLLDTHTARPGMLLVRDPSSKYDGEWYSEDDSMLAGMQSRSFWPTKMSLEQAMHDAGWSARHVSSDDKNLHGPRSMYMLERNA